jgi:hypothetical protein
MTNYTTLLVENQAPAGNKLALHHWRLSRRYLLAAKALCVTHRGYYLERAVFYVGLAVALAGKCDSAITERDQ